MAKQRIELSKSLLHYNHSKFLVKANLEAKTYSFDIAYDSYYYEIQKYVVPNAEVLEIGGGAHPSVIDRENLKYTIIDPDSKELEKAPQDVQKLNLLLENINVDKQYDLVITKMVLEHVADPEAFHRKVFDILKPNGKAIHFFACRHSIPSFVNRILPEKIGDGVLKMISNRDLKESPKYPAFYLKTKGYSKGQINFFKGLQFSILKYSSFVGHKYFKNILGLGFIEKLYTRVLVLLRLRSLSTVAIVVLKKEIQN